MCFYRCFHLIRACSSNNRSNQLQDLGIDSNYNFRNEYHQNIHIRNPHFSKSELDPVLILPELNTLFYPYENKYHSLSNYLLYKCTIQKPIYYEISR